MCFAQHGFSLWLTLRMKTWPFFQNSLTAMCCLPRLPFSKGHVSGSIASAAAFELCSWVVWM